MAVCHPGPLSIAVGVRFSFFVPSLRMHIAASISRNALAGDDGKWLPCENTVGHEESNPYNRRSPHLPNLLQPATPGPPLQGRSRALAACGKPLTGAVPARLNGRRFGGVGTPPGSRYTAGAGRRRAVAASLALCRHQAVAAAPQQ